ncbi:hypothetical protein IV102_02910 [bacterium]|nr:hypothetical protein [bacterium]
MNCHLHKMGLVGLLTLIGCLVGRAQPSPAEWKHQLATVESERLLQSHPSYSKLLGLDEEMRELVASRQHIFDQARQKAIREGRNSFQKILIEARQQLESEQAAVKREIEGLARSKQAETARELAEIQTQLETDLKKLQSGLSEQSTDLQIMATRSLSVFKLEQEKSLKLSLDGERERLDGQLAAYEDQVGARYQDEKLSLHMKLQNNPSPDDEKAIRQRLNAIEDEMAATKVEKRKATEEAMLTFHKQRRAEFEQNLTNYEARLRLEYESKLKPPAQAMETIRKAQQTMRLTAKTRKSELVARINEMEADARIDLATKDSEIQRQLRKVEMEIRWAASQSSKHLDKPTLAKLAHLDQQISQLISRRQQLSQNMHSGLTAVVGQVATKNSIQCVIGQCILNLHLEDLSDRSLAGMSQLPGV